MKKNKKILLIHYIMKRKNGHLILYKRNKKIFQTKNQIKELINKCLKIKKNMKKKYGFQLIKFKE